MSMVLDGTNGLTFPNSSTQVYGSVGIGQTWQNVLGSRSMNTTYTNSTGKPIQLSIAGQDYRGGQDGYVTVVIDGLTVGQSGDNNSSYKKPATTNPIVPNGSTYSVNTGEVSYDFVTVWFELR
jgi:hypothetical protein